MAELVPGLTYETFVAEAARHRTDAGFRASLFYRRHGAALDHLLSTPRPIDPPCHAAPRPPDGTLRVAHWNIEKGKELPLILRHLREDPGLAACDVFCFNEVDDGMNRSGSNADVAAELAAALEAPAWYLPTYIECTKGLPLERRLPGENSRGLHGVAIVSRRPVRELRSIELPVGWDYFDYPEKRFGGRRALVARVDIGGAEMVVATAHLEMRARPGTRDRQMAAWLAGLEALDGEWGSRPTILTGDFNTHTFRRGRFVDTVSDFLRIVTRSPEALEAELLDPRRREPLFARLERAGYDTGPFNDREATASHALAKAEDLKYFSKATGRRILRSFRLEDRVVPLRLDWIAARGCRPAGPPETRPYGPEGTMASDHAPIVAALAPAAG